MIGGGRSLWNLMITKSALLVYYHYINIPTKVNSLYFIQLKKKKYQKKKKKLTQTWINDMKLYLGLCPMCTFNNLDE
jgi:hypothetical protein